MVHHSHSLNRVIGVLLVVLAAASGSAFAAASGPGSGTATINPVTATVAVPGTWTIVYNNPTDMFTNGTLRVTIPDGWTAPQKTDPAAAGFLTVSSDGPVPAPPFSIAGQVVTITVTDLPKPKIITIVYGQDSTGIHPGAKAVPPTTSNPAATFLVASDPAGSSPVPIAASPAVNLKPGTIFDIQFVGAPYVFPTTSEGGPYSVVAKDTYGNSSPVTSNQQINLSSNAPSGSFSILGGGAFVPVSSVTMASGTHTATFFYRDTIPGTPTLTASAPSNPSWGSPTQMQTVNAGPAAQLDLSPSAATVTVEDYTRITIDVQDVYGNPTALTVNREISLISSATVEASPPAQPSGLFYLPGDHVNSIETLDMTVGQQTAQVDFRSTDANGGSPHSIVFISDTPSPVVSGSTSITVTPGAVSGATSSTSAMSPVIAGGSSTVTVRVTDAYGNPRSGVVVTLAASGSAVATNPAAPTNSNGEATGSVTDNTAETVTVNAWAGGVAILDTAQILFSAGGVSEDVSQVVAVSPVVADGVTQSQITVTALDDFGNPVRDLLVVLNFTPSGDGAVLTQPLSLTDVNGHAYGYLKSTKTGPRTVTATIDGTPITDDAVVQFEPGELSYFEWSFTGPATAGVPTNVTLEAFDAQDNLITDYAESVSVWTSTTGVTEFWTRNGASGILEPEPGGEWYYKFVPSDGGSAGLTVRVTKAETITLSAKRVPVTDTSGPLVVDHAAADSIAIVSGDDQSAQVNALVTSDLIVRVRDEYDNPVDAVQVTYGDITGGGWIDVVAGGARDSVATTGLDGQARCQDWRLGTTAGENTVTASLETGPSVLFSATGTPAAQNTIVWTTTSRNVTVGSATEVGAVLEDQYGNAISGVLLTIFISSGSGTLEANPSDPNPTTFLGPGTRQGTTDGQGRITVLYRAPMTAGLQGIVDASTGAVPSTSVPDLTFTSVAEGATQLRIVWEAGQTSLAGQTFRFRIRAVDGNDNIDTGNTSVISLTPQAGSGIVFSESDWGATVTQVMLAGGEKVVYGRAYTTGTWSFTADDYPPPGTLAPDSESVVISPYYASGTITATANPDVITATGTTTSTLTSNQIRDPFNNIVAPGTFIRVATINGLGTIISTDADPSTPATIERPTNAEGRITLVLQSGTTAGTERVSMNAVSPGTATGTKDVIFAPRPVIANARGLDPSIVTPGQPVPFSVLVDNTSPTGLTLNTATTISFSDGEETYEANLQSGTPVNGLASGVTLTFASEVVPNSMDPGAYTPLLTLRGTDQYGSAIPVTPLSLPLNSLRVSAVEIESIALDPPIISRGQTGTITVRVNNQGPITASIESVTFSFGAGNQHFDYEPVLSPAVNIPGATAVNIDVPVTVLQTAPQGLTSVNAAVAGNVSGTPVLDSSLAPYLPLPNWDIRQGADITYEAGTLTPMTVSRTRTHALSVELTNNGDTTVELLASGTTISFAGGAYTAALTQNEPISAGASKTVQFSPVVVSAAIPADQDYDVTIHLEGLENLVPFTTDLLTSSAGDAIRVVTQANVTYVAGTLTPTTVTRTVSTGFSLQVSNSGTAAVELAAGSTTFSFGTDTFYLSGNTTIKPAGQGNTILAFSSKVVNSAAGGPYPAQLHLVGIENTLAFDRTPTVSNQVTVQNPAQLSIQSINGSQASITKDQARPITMTMIVENNSSAAVDFESANLQFLLNGTTDLTTSFTITPPTGFETSGVRLPGNTTDALVFTITDGAGAMTPGNYVIEGNLYVRDAVGGQQIYVNTAGGGKGSLAVQNPGVLDIVSTSSQKSTVTVSQTQPWVVNMTVRNTGQAAVTLSLAPGTTNVLFSLGSGWVYPIQSAGPITLGQNESTALAFQVTQAGNTPGAATINGFVGGIEENSGVPRNDVAPTTTGSVIVQTPANPQITQVVASRDTVTESQSGLWTIKATLTNTGEAAVTLSSAAAETYVNFPTSVPANFRVTGPTGNLALPGLGSTELTFNVAPTPAFGGVAGSKAFDVRIQGTESNRGIAIPVTSSESVYVQLQPDPLYVADSFTPSAVKAGDEAEFRVVFSEQADAARIVFTGADTWLRFTDGTTTFQRFVNTAKTPDIDAGGNTTVWFQTGVVPAAFSTGDWPVTVHLGGTHNGNPFGPRDYPVGTITIREPTSVRVDTMIALRDRVSASQSRDWDVQMVVENTGSGDIAVLGSTRLVFRIEGLGDAAGYEWNLNSNFKNSGDDTLRAGQSDTLTFTVTRTGFDPGNLSVYGIFDGRDTKAQIDISDDTFDSGWATLRVERPGALQVTGVQTSQPTVTQGQTAPWNAIATVNNTGEAAVELTFDATEPSPRPDIRFVPDSGFDWTPPSSLQGGGTILAGGAQGTLIFSVSPTGTNAGTPIIHAVVAGVDTNSLAVTEWDTETQSSGFGSITVQERGNALVRATTIASPNAPQVNIGQVFGVRVEIANEGGANLEDVSYSISTGGSTPAQPELIAAAIAAGTAFVDTFLVTADDVTGPETLTVDITGARDANSQQLDLFVDGPDVDSTAIAQKGLPSLLVVDSVTTSQPAVTRSQTQDWTIDVAVTNQGGAGLDVVGLSPSDIEFSLGAQVLTGYVVVAPTRFVNRAGLRLNAGESDILRYTVDVTGGDTGDVTITAAVDWRDGNDGSVSSVQGMGGVTVVSPSGFMIAETYADPATAPNSPQPNLVLVNDGRAFSVRVVVQNSNGGDAVEDLENVVVRLSSDYVPSPVNRTSLPVEILRNTSHTFVFDDVQLASLGAAGLRQEILTATIVSARSKQTGQNVAAGQPVDNQEIVVLQKPALLRALALLQSGTVSTDQEFTVTGRVENDGVAAVDTTGRIALELPPGFALKGGQTDTLDFRVSVPVAWTVIAPSTPAADQIINVRITRSPNDKNIAEPAALANGGVGTTQVDVVQKAGFVNAALAVSQPSGATDNTLSTLQQFTLRARVEAEVTTTDIQATLVLVSAPGFTVIDPLVRDLGNGTGGETAVTWRVTAPSAASAGRFQVIFDGADQNNHGESVSDTTDVLDVTVVDRARLSVTAVIARPPEARDGLVAIGSRFEIDGSVANLGIAGVDTAGARVRINFTDAPEYTVVPGTGGLQRSFTVGETITWVVSAPQAAAPPRNIRIEISGVPDDENTNGDAFVQTSTDFVPVQTDNVFITAENVSGALGFDARVVPRGTSGVEMLGVELVNTDLSAGEVAVRTIRVSLMNGSGELAAAPSSVLSEIYATVGGRTVNGSLAAQNPIVFDFTGTPEIRLDPSGPDSAATIRFVVSVRGDAALNEIVIGIEDPDDFEIRGVAPPNNLIPVVDKETKGSIAGKLRSRSLVLLSDNFEEYAHNYPNPFRAGAELTRIAFKMEDGGSVNVRVFDLMGELVYEKQYGPGEATRTADGAYEVRWDGANMMGEVVRNGIYICQLEAGGKSTRIRIAVAR